MQCKLFMGVKTSGMPTLYVKYCGFFHMVVEPRQKLHPFFVMSSCVTSNRDMEGSWHVVDHAITELFWQLRTTGEISEMSEGIDSCSATAFDFLKWISVFLASIPVSGNCSWNSGNSPVSLFVTSCSLTYENLTLVIRSVEQEYRKCILHFTRRKRPPSSSRNAILQPFIGREYIAVTSVMNDILWFL